MRAKSTVVLAVLTAFIGTSVGTQALAQNRARAQAQPQAQPNEMFSVLTVEVRPGANGAFEEFVGKFRAAAEQTNSPARWLALASASGRPTYTFTRAFGRWSDFVEQDVELAPVYGEAETQRLFETLQSSAANISTAIYAARPDLSRPWPQLQQPPAAAMYVDLLVRLGAEQRFENYVKKLIEAANAVAPEQYWLMRQRVFGEGDEPAYRVIVVFRQWAELDVPPKPLPQLLREHFGAAEAERLEAERGEALVGVQQTLHRVRTDLARPPP